MKSTPQPMTHEEMREMRRNGDTVSTIVQRARIRNGLRVGEVRAILFGGEPS